MSTVWKFLITPGDVTEIRMPIGSVPLRVGAQQNIPCIWALVDPGAEDVVRRFRVAGTGHTLPPEAREYLGSFELFDQELIFHVFEILS